MSDNYILIKNLFNDETISLILNKANKKRSLFKGWKSSG